MPSNRFWNVPAAAGVRSLWGAIGLCLMAGVCGAQPAPPCTSLTSGGTNFLNVLMSGEKTSYNYFVDAAPAGCSWTASNNNGSWFTSLTPSGLGSGILTAFFPSNTTQTVQGGALTVRSAGVTLTLVASINPVSCRFTAVPASLNFGASGTGLQFLTVTPSPSTCDVALSSDSAWLTPGYTFQGGGPVTIRVSPPANPSAARAGSFSTCCTTADISIPVSQDGATPTATCTTLTSNGSAIPTDYLLTGDRTSFTYPIEAAPAGCTWTVTNTSPSWVTSISPDSGTGSGSFQLVFPSNTTGVFQTGRVLVHGAGNLTLQLGVKVNPTSCRFTASPASLNFPAAGGSQPLTVTPSPFGCGMFITPSAGASWLTPALSFQDGSVGGDFVINLPRPFTITATASANPGAQRTAAFTTSGSTANITIPVSQDGNLAPSILDVSAADLNFRLAQGQLPPPQNVGISSSFGTLVWSVVTQLTSPVPVNWLSISAASGSASPDSPGGIAVSVGAAALGFPPGIYTANLVVSSGTQTKTIPVTLTVEAVSTGTSATISHVVDGGNWSTTIILVNTDTVPAPFTLRFTNDSGAAFAPSIVGLGNQSTVSGTIAPGGSRTISTSGTAPGLTEGWARVSSSQSLSGTAIFRLQLPSGSPVPYQEAAVPLLASGSSTLLFPFDGNPGLATGFALAAPDNSGTTNVTRRQRSQSGVDITTALDAQNTPFVDGNCLALPAHGHCADVLNVDSTLAQNLRGVAEFVAQGGGLFGLGIRSNGGAFTSIEAVTKQAASTKVISHIADSGAAGSGRWKTTIILVNTDTVPASFTVSFWQDNGNPFPIRLVGGAVQTSVSGTIPVGGTYTIETADAPGVTTTGWAEVLSGQSVGGTAIFREEGSGQEAAVPLLTSGGTRLSVPFDVGGGLALGVALANQSLSQDATVTYTLRDESGNPLRDANSNPLVNVPIVWGDGSPAGLLPRHQHKSFVLTLPSPYTNEQRGVAEFNSSSGIFILGIRANRGAFTSVRALGQ